MLPIWLVVSNRKVGSFAIRLDALLQKLRPSHLEAYDASATGSKSTLTVHHTVVHGALKKAKRDWRRPLARRRTAGRAP